MLRPCADTQVQIPTFEEGRLRYRAPRMADFESYAAFRASERSAGVGGPFSHSDSFNSMAALVGHWQLRGFGRWIIADPDTDAALGVVGLFYPHGWPEPEIGWSVFEHAEGKGLAYEAACFARRYAYDVLGWKRVVSCITQDNTRSIALARRMGCVQESEFTHEDGYKLIVWRHLAPEAVA